MILLFAIRQKFAQNPKLMERLIGTGEFLFGLLNFIGNQLLVQAFEGDSFMASGMNTEEMNKWAEEHKNEVLQAYFSCI